jgi:hypothetical protein
LNFFGSKSSLSSPTPARFRIVAPARLGFGVAGPLLTTGLRRRAGSGRPTRRWWRAQGRQGQRRWPPIRMVEEGGRADTRVGATMKEAGAGGAIAAAAAGELGLPKL